MRACLATFAFAAALLIPAAGFAQEGGAAPLPPAESSGPTEMNSPAMLATGSALAGLGVGAIATGAVMWGEDPCTGAGSNDQGEWCGMGFGRLGGMLFMGTGALLALTGTPLIIAGAWQVPEAGEPAPTAALRIGAGRAELGVTF